MKFDVVESDMYVGGLALFWHPFVKLNLVKKFTNCMNCKVADVFDGGLNEWSLILVHGVALCGG